MHRSILLIASLATAAHAADPAASFQDGKNFSTTGGGYSASSQINDAKGAEVVPGYSGNNSASQYFQGGDGILSGPAVGKINSCAGASGLTGGHGYAGQECNAIDFVAKNPMTRTQYPISKQDPLLIRADTITENPEAYIPAPGSNLSECVSTVVTSPDRFEIEHCYEYHVAENHFCAVGRIVEVDRDANYQCTMTTHQKSRQTCYKTLVCVSGGDGCDSGGINPGSISATLKYDWYAAGGGDYYMLIGNNQDDIYGGGFHEATAYFDVIDPARITKFILEWAAYDDYIWVTLNDQTVWVGPDGGDRLESCCLYPEIEEQCTYDYWSDSYTCKEVVTGCWSQGVTEDGVTCRVFERSGPHDVKKGGKTINKDVRHLLRKGQNKIWMKIAVGGRGDMVTRWRTRQLCPPNCNWDDQCWQLDARTK